MKNIKRIATLSLTMLTALAMSGCARALPGTDLGTNVGSTTTPSNTVKIVDDSINVGELTDKTSTLNVFSNDTIPSGDSPSVISPQSYNGALGTLTIAANGDVSFVQNSIILPAGAQTSEIFPIQISDNGFSYSSKITVTIDGVSDFVGNEVSVAIAFDALGAPGSPEFQKEKDTVAGAIDQLSTEGEVKLSVISFDTSATVVASADPLTSSNKAAVLNAVNNVSWGGGALAATDTAIAALRSELSSLGTARKKIALLFSFYTSASSRANVPTQAAGLVSTDGAEFYVVGLSSSALSQMGSFDSTQTAEADLSTGGAVESALGTLSEPFVDESCQLYVSQATCNASDHCTFWPTDGLCRMKSLD